MKMRLGVPIATVVCMMLGTASAAPPTFTVSLGNRTGCVSPTTRHYARADGGNIDVQSIVPGVLAASLTGSVGANAYLGHSGVASETFHLVQDFEITCSDASVSEVALTLESSLIGFVRSKRNGSACVQVASAAVTPAGFPASPLSTAYPSMCVAGTDGRLCNQHNEPVIAKSLPLGKYVLTADLVLEAEASGLCDGHSAADFTPAAALPAEFVRLRDPFQNADKKNFGFSLTLTAAPVGSPVALRRRDDARIVRSSAPSAQVPQPIRTTPVRSAFAASGPQFIIDSDRASFSDFLDRPTRAG